MNKQNEQISTIKKFSGEKTIVYKPKLCGIIHDVYIAENGDTKTVYRFGNKITAKHNLFASQKLKSIGLTVPDVSIHDIDGQCFETYPFLEGKTFHERIIEGMSPEKQDTVYKQLFDISYQISTIPYDEQFELKMPLVLKTTSLVFKLCGVKNKKLYHTDLHAKNVILDNQDNVCALIDLDAVYPEYFSVVLIRLIKDAQKYGYDTEKLKTFSKSAYKQIDFLNLEKQIKIYSGLRNTFRFFVNDFMYKQLLKIRIK